MNITSTMILGWIATACTLVGFYLVTYNNHRARACGFATCALGDVLWIAWALILNGLREGMPIISVNVAMLVAASIGILKNRK